jgi:hypothetical protein
VLTFSCLRCLRSFSSRYVRFDRTGVLNGFIIFLIATAWLVSWSFAELRAYQYTCLFVGLSNIPDETKGSHTNGLQVSVPLQRQSLPLSECGVSAHLLVISNVVPKIWARTNSAMVKGGSGGSAAGASGSGYRGGWVVLLVQCRESRVNRFAQWASQTGHVYWIGGEGR